MSNKSIAALILLLLAGFSLPGKVYSANEQIVLADWDQFADWESNSTCPEGPKCVAVCVPSSQAVYFYPSVDEYVKGVLNAELIRDKWGRAKAFQTADPNSWLVQEGYLEGYKAQAIAARNMLTNYRLRNRGGSACSAAYDVINSEANQVDYGVTRDYYQNHLDAIAGDAAGKVITYPAFSESFTEATFFSNTTRILRDTTLNSEEAIAKYPWTYKPYLRSSANLRSDEETHTNNASFPANGGHGVGLSQFGAMHLSKHDSVGYQQILEHYYHASPPYVKKLVIKQGTVSVYVKEWEDQFLSPFDPLRGRREKPGSVNLQVDSTQDLSVEVYYSEDVGNTFPVTMNIEGCASAPAPGLSVDLTFRTIETVGGTKYYNRAVGSISKSDISASCLRAGSHQIRLMARHRYVGAWTLDSNPATVSFDGSEGATRYEQGTDLNHELLVSTTPPQKPTNFDGKPYNGGVKFTWTAPTRDTAGNLLTAPPQYRVYYSRDPNDANPSFWPATGESLDEAVANGTTLLTCVSAVDALGNESECSELDSVEPKAARWVYPPGTPPGPYYTSILAALTNVPNRTTIMVGPGVYEEPDIGLGDHIVSGWAPQDIWLMSERGPAETKIITGQIEVADQCRMVGFTLQNPTGRVLNIYFDEGVLIANNIFVGSQTAIFSGGTMSPRSEEKVNRIYNNVFAGNVVGIDMWSSYAVTDIRNNLFERLTDNGRAVIFDVVCGNAFVANNNFHGYGDDTPRQNKCAVIEANSTCSPAFMELKADDLLGSDFHLEETTTCGLT